MNTFVWVVTLILLGLVTGKIVGLLTAFTRGPGVYDVVAGVLGAVTGGVLLRLVGPSSFHAPLLTLLTGVGAAFLATWLMRIATWPPEPPLRRPDDTAPDTGDAQRSHDMMTTGDGTRVFLRQGRLVVPGAHVSISPSPSA